MICTSVAVWLYKLKNNAAIQKVACESKVKRKKISKNQQTSLSGARTLDISVDFCKIIKAERSTDWANRESIEGILRQEYYHLIYVLQLSLH